MSDGAYYTSEEGLLTIWSKLSSEERKEKREGFIKLRKFHRFAQNHGIVSRYTRFLRILNEVEDRYERMVQTTV